MNPGQLNKRIKFLKETSTQNEFGGAETTLTPVTGISNSVDTSVTWGALEPIKQYHQFAIEAGASVLNNDRILKIRKRSSFTPDKTMLFQDVSDPNNIDTYTIVAVAPYWPGTKQAFENSQSAPYHDQFFLYIIGVKRS